MKNLEILENIIKVNNEEIPIVWNGDVVVVGAGPGGLGAAIAANRCGSKTLMIEKYGFMGGMCSYGCGMPLGGAYPAYQSNGGIGEEILKDLMSAGNDAPDVRKIPNFSYWYFHDSEYFKSYIAKLILKEGIDIRLHTMVVDVIKTTENKIDGVVLESKSGRQAVLAKKFVDASGDADLCAWAGADFVKGRDGDNAMMAMTIPYIISNVDTEQFVAYKETDPDFSLAMKKALELGVPISTEDKLKSIHVGMRPRTLFNNAIRVRNVDGTKVEDLTKAELESRIRINDQINFLRKLVPGCENAYVSATGDQVGVRDTRRIIGEDYLSTEDCVNMRKRKDTILRCGGPFDDADRGNDKGTVTPLQDHDWYDVPYGCLVPKGVDNIIISGRTLSSSHLAQAGSRGQALLIGMGQSAGTAAHLAVQTDCAFNKLDVSLLQKKLLEDGLNLYGDREAE